MDPDGDGMLSFNDLFRLYSRYIFCIKHPNEQRLVVDPEVEEEYNCIYTQEVLSAIVKQIIDTYDQDGDEVLSYKEYLNAITEWDIREFIDVYFV